MVESARIERQGHVLRALSFAALLSLPIVAMSCGLLSQSVDEILVVAPGTYYTYTLTLSCGTDVHLTWDSVNRNTASGTLGGAADGTPGDVDVTLAGPGLNRTWPRSVRSSAGFAVPEGGGVYSLTFENGHSIVSAKQVRLTGEIGGCF